MSKFTIRTFGTESLIECQASKIYMPILTVVFVFAGSILEMDTNVLLLYFKENKLLKIIIVRISQWEMKNLLPPFPYCDTWNSLFYLLFIRITSMREIALISKLAMWILHKLSTSFNLGFIMRIRTLISRTLPMDKLLT